MEDRGAFDFELAVGGEADLEVGHLAAYGAYAHGAGVVAADDGRGFGEAIAFEDAGAGGCEPVGGIDAEGRAAGDEDADAASEGFADFCEDENVGEVPCDAVRFGAGEDHLALGNAGADGPGEDAFGEAGVGGFGFDALADFLINAGYTDEDGGVQGLEGGGQVVEAGEVRDGDAVSHLGVVDVAGGDVREGEEGNAEVAFGEGKAGGGDVDVGGEVAVGELDSLGLAGGAGGVDEGGEVVGLDGLELVVEGLVAGFERGGGLHDFGEAYGLVEGAGVHDDEVLEVGAFGAAGLDFFVLLFGAHDGYFGAGILEHVDDVLGGAGGVEGDVGGSEGEHGHVGDGPLPAVFAEQDYAVAFADAPFGELLGEGADAAVEGVGGDGGPASLTVGGHEGGVGAAAGGGEGHVVDGG